MECKNCGLQIPEDDSPYCEECDYIFYLFTNNVISDQERGERHRDQRLLVASSTPGYVDIPHGTTINGPVVGGGK